MKTSTVIIIAIIIICLCLVVANRYHHRHHHYHVDKLEDNIKNILNVQPEKMMKRDDFIKALEHRYNCHKKDALWLLGYAKEHDIVTFDDKWVELKKK